MQVPIGLASVRISSLLCTANFPQSYLLPFTISSAPQKPISKSKFNIEKPDMENSYHFHSTYTTPSFFLFLSHSLHIYYASSLPLHFLIFLHSKILFVSSLQNFNNIRTIPFPYYSPSWLYPFIQFISTR